jgi:hypothetical protein
MLGRLALASALTLGCANTRPPVAPVAAAPEPGVPRYNDKGELLPPTDFRTWVFLTSGFAMSYGPVAQAAGANGLRLHDNVYVGRAAHAAFLASGRWPEETMFVLEIRAAESEGSINEGGQFQTDLAGVEVAIKDSKRFPDGGWAYFVLEHDDVGPTRPTAALPRTANCYSCHEASGAVENTFTQFYPTLYPVAVARGTLNDDFEGMPTTANELYAAVAAHGWAAGDKLIDETARHWPDANLFRERSLNGVAYRLLLAGKPNEAIELFERVTVRYPASANAWDSLSEAYETAGDKGKARAAAEKAMSLLPDDPNVSPQLRERLEQALRERLARLPPT